MFRWSACREDRKCCVSQCTTGARHVYVQDFPTDLEVAYCCEHFTQVIGEIFNARDAIYARATQNALQELEKRIHSIITLHQRMDEESKRLARELKRKAATDE